MPFKPGEREYRNFASTFTAEPDGADEYRVRGYATTFDVPYDFGPYGDREVVLSTALDGADMSDVIFQLNHEGPPLARQKNGSLKLEVDKHGLGVEARLNGSRQARDQYEAIASGLIDKMSWGFMLAEDGYEYDPDQRLYMITKVTKVFDVSCVSIPADQDTEIFARSYINGAIERERRESAQREKRARQMAALKLRLI